MHVAYEIPKILSSEKICENFRRRILLLSLLLKKKIIWNKNLIKKKN